MKGKKEELPFLADYARAYFMRDQNEFVIYSPDYETFLAKFDPQVTLVKEAVATSKIVAEQKALTKRIKSDYKSARNWVNKVENYATKAGKALVTSIDDFGFKVLRKDFNVKNDEGTILRFRTLLQHIDANIAALQPKGLTPTIRTNLGTFIGSFETDIKNQTFKIDERKDLVKDNNNEFAILWDMVNADILKTGKVIFKEKDPTKVKDYTFSELLKKIRMARKEEEEKPKA